MKNISTRCLKRVLLQIVTTARLYISQQLALCAAKKLEKLMSTLLEHLGTLASTALAFFPFVVEPHQCFSAGSTACAGFESRKFPTAYCTREV